MNLILIIIIKLLQKARLYETHIKRKFHKLLFKKKINYKDYESDNYLQNGYYKFLKDDFKKNNLTTNVEKILSIADEIINNKSKIKSTGNRHYLRNLLDEGDVENRKTFLNFVLDDFFVSKVRDYLNEEPLLTELKVLLSPISINPAEEFLGSQLFHRDFDDESIVKIFFYLTDVDQETGPLQIIDKNMSKSILNKTNFRYNLRSDKVGDLINKDDIISLFGKKGDCYMVDTSQCYHRGARELKKDRLILYANFSTRSSFRFPPLFLNNKNKTVISHHSPLAKYSFLVDKKKSFYLRNI